MRSEKEIGNSDKVGLPCYIKALEPVKTDGMRDTAYFIIIREFESTYWVTGAISGNTVYEIAKSEVIFEDRIKATIPEWARK